MPDAYLRSEILIFNKEELPLKYPNFQTIDQRSPWESIVITPTKSGGYVFVFRLQVRLEITKSTRIYFEAIGNVLSFYPRDKWQGQSFTLESAGPNAEEKPASNDDLRYQPLTKRQRTILALIQEGLTNSQIAGEIGYSESLVRQETILIYSKLGVRGRVDLRAENKSLRVSR
jgi:DNA-binding CsgD family transcriptional regulator